MPDAVSLRKLQEATNVCDTMAKLKYRIVKKGYCTNDPDLKPFKHVFRELMVAKQLILRGERIVVPKKLQEDVIALAHESHQGE